MIEKILPVLTQFKLLLIIIGIIGFVIGVNIYFLIRKLKKKKYLSSLKNFFTAVILGLIFIILTTVASTLHKYRILSNVYTLGKITTFKTEEGFLLKFHSKTETLADFSLKMKGEEFAFEGVFIDFKEYLELLGIKPIFVLTSVYGRDGPDEVYDLHRFNPGLYPRLEFFMKKGKSFFFIEKVYRSAVMQYPREEPEFYSLEQSTHNIYIKPVENGE